MQLLFYYSLWPTICPIRTCTYNWARFQQTSEDILTYIHLAYFLFIAQRPTESIFFVSDTENIEMNG